MKNRLKFFNSIHNQRGVSIVELLVAAFIMAIVCAFTLNAFIGKKDAGNIQAEVSDAQQSATFSLTELTVAVRNAGFGVPTGTRPYRIKIGTLAHDTLIVYYQNGANTDSTRYFLAHTGADAAQPCLKRRINNLTPQVFAENIEDVDFIEVGPVGALGAKSITVSLTARTESVDKHLNDYRRRTVSSNVQIANASL